MARTTLADMAKLLNVSKVTISKALRNHPDVSSELKTRINDLAIELGYTPNYIARNLYSRRTRTIGVVVPDVSNSFFSYAVHGIIDSADKAGYQIIVTISREEEAMERKNLNTLISMRVDGILISISQNTHNYDVFTAVKKAETPLVFFDRTLPDLGFTSVSVNDYQSAFRAVNYAIQKGYRKIAHLAGTLNTSIGRERCNGYQKALLENNLTVTDEWVIENGFTIEDGKNGFEKLWKQDNKPELIFTVNGHVASGAYAMAQKMGLKIPGDIAFIGFGFREYTDMFNPPMTIISENPDLLGRTAFATLLHEIESKTNEGPKQIVLPLELELRSSC